ncbi:CdiA C-terminal domain-containing protein [Carbonactinospora thermoautotrophica]|uniref:CdiA C-terminal domain-containing protein n=1 Tax=Carbonactinospora thermoautotrophica TaxID=1469144 RepID=UPI000834DBCB|nr:hypothetical protein [Carbonactinospora thermoautotrophica]
MLPGELVFVLDLLGFTWPQADEDKLEDCARAWRDFADEVEHVLADADRVARAVVAENQGVSIAAFEEYWPRLGGGSGQLREAADAARLVADVLEGFAEAVRWAKRLVLAQLVACAASLAAGPLSAAAQQGFRLAIRKALDELLERVVRSLLPRLKSEVGEVFARILREPRRHLEDFAAGLRASLQGMGGPPLALAGDAPAGALARRLDDLTHVEAGGGGPNLMAMLSGNGPSKLSSGTSKGGKHLGPKRPLGHIDESDAQFNDAERKLAELLKSEGKHVKAVPRQENVRTPDALVDGVPTEFKTLTKPNPKTLKYALDSAKGQSGNALIDARGIGMTQENVQKGLELFLKYNPNRMQSIRIVGDDFEIIWP